MGIFRCCTCEGSPTTATAMAKKKQQHRSDACMSSLSWNDAFAVCVVGFFVVSSLTFLKQVVDVGGTTTAAGSGGKSLRVVADRSNNNNNNNAKDIVATAASGGGDLDDGGLFDLDDEKEAFDSDSEDAFDVDDDDVGNVDDDDDRYAHPIPELFLVGGDGDGHKKQLLIDKLPVPLRVLERYKEWHGVEALRSEYRQRQLGKQLGNDNNSNNKSRKYAVVFYSCPVQAGNRLHHYMTGMLWSVLTNRTMLYKYWDRDTCQNYGRDFSQKICDSSNNATTCDAILHRAGWIPSYDEWAPRLLSDSSSSSRQSEEPYELPFYATHPSKIKNGRYPWGPGNDQDSFGVDVKYQDRPVVIFAQTRFKITFLNSRDVRDTLLHSEWSRQTSDQLNSLGTDFLFGSLFRYSFDLSRHMKESAAVNSVVASDADDRKSTSTVPSVPYTVALHSRHIDEQLDGCDISREKRCMNRLLANSIRPPADDQNAGGVDRAPRPCVVKLMSDRQCTINEMTAWLERNDCAVEVASHETTTDYLSEHGPFAGAGFFQDLALASTARSAFVGLSRSSSDLLLELIEFNRKVQAWRSGLDPRQLPDVDKCILKKIIPAKRNEKDPETDATLVPNTDEEETPAPEPEPRDDNSDVSPAYPSSCSCYNREANVTCCERVIRRSHKQGFVLTRQVFGGGDLPSTYPSPVEITQKFRHELPPEKVDYRDVVFTRDWYETLVSGKFTLINFNSRKLLTTVFPSTHSHTFLDAPLFL